MPEETVVAETPEIEIPEDYKAFTAFRDAGSGGESVDAPAVKVPAAGKDKTPPSEPVEEVETGQIAEESEPEDETEQEETDEDQVDDDPDDEPEDKEPAKAVKSEKNTRLSKRMRELTGEIKALKSQLLANKPAAVDEEADAEVVSATEPVAAAEMLKRPMLKDFEDTDDTSAWDQYEAARDAYDEQRLSTALAKQESALELKHATENAQANWNKASQRFSDYNEVVSAGAQISQAMESVMRMDPETGTALAYYLGQHPEESEVIARATLATSEKQWNTALVNAGMALGEIRAKLKLTPPGKTAEPVKAPVKAVTAPSPQLKKVTSASKPPSQIRGGTEQPKPDVLSDNTAADYRKWNRAREAQLKR